MNFYPKQQRCLFAVDCVLFSYDDDQLKVLLSKRTTEPFKGQWRLIGGFINEKQSADETAKEILKNHTGMDNMYMEQLHAFTDIGKGTNERTISLTYFALINKQEYKEQNDQIICPQWFAIENIPELIDEHIKILEFAKERIKYKAAMQPLLFELLPSKFTILQLHTLYEKVFHIQLDRRNINRKLKESNILVKLSEKDKISSKKGSFYYKLSYKKIKNFNQFGSIVPLKYHLLS